MGYLLGLVGPLDSDGEVCRHRDELGGLLVAIPVVIRQSIDKTGVLEHLDGTALHEVLGYVVFECSKDID